MSNQRLSVLQLVPSLESGGVERGTLEVSRELVRRGHRSIVISGGGRLVRSLVADGAEHVEWPIGRKSPLTLGCVARLRRLLQSERIDIIHARSRIPAWVGWLCWRTLPDASRPRFVTTMHGLNSVNWFSRIMTRGEVVVAVSHAVREYLLSHYPDVPQQRLRVIHRGIDASAFPYGFQPAESWRENWNREFPETAGRAVLTLAGRITRLKGHHDFLNLLADLKASGRPVLGLIVGDEDPRRRQYAAEVRQRVRDLDLTGEVTFLGHRSDIREVYAVSDIVMSLSSKPESFGRTTLEPLAMGIPVVGYDHGGVGEILQEVFPTGRVPLGDRRELSDTVSGMLESPQRVPPFSSFRLQSMLDDTLALYSELAGHPEQRLRSRAA